MFRYHTLDALRFFAFLKVFLLHLPLTEQASFFNFIKQGGGTGVALFFVLSGFLITDRLLKLSLSQKWSAPIFFLRRALRIWPLYFLGVLLAFAGIAITDYLGVSNSNGYNPHWFYSLFFIENYRMIWEGTYPRGVPLRVFWSLCIEEHFYILWILIFKWVHINQIFNTLIKLLGLSVILRLFVTSMFPNYAISGAELFTSMDYFALGGLVAWLKIKFPNANVPAWTQVVVVVFAALFLLFQHTFYDALGVWGITLTATVYSALLGVLVFPGSGRVRIGNAHILSYLGTLSYGLYVFHTPVLLAVITLFNQFAIPTQSNLGVLLVACLSLIITIGVSALSYRYFEIPFLKLRGRLSGPTQ